jgi:hypothetical protein
MSLLSKQPAGHLHAFLKCIRMISMQELRPKATESEDLHFGSWLLWSVSKPHREIMLQVPNGAYGHFLLGRIARLTNRPDKAIAHFEKSLILNPMLWSAYEELCSLGPKTFPCIACSIQLQPVDNSEHAC